MAVRLRFMLIDVPGRGAGDVFGPSLAAGVHEAAHASPGEGSSEVQDPREGERDQRLPGENNTKYPILLHCATNL